MLFGMHTACAPPSSSCLRSPQMPVDDTVYVPGFGRAHCAGRGGAAPTGARLEQCYSCPVGRKNMQFQLTMTSRRYKHAKLRFRIRLTQRLLEIPVAWAENSLQGIAEFVFRRDMGHGDRSVSSAGVLPGLLPAQPVRCAFSHHWYFFQILSSCHCAVFECSVLPLQAGDSHEVGEAEGTRSLLRGSDTFQV